MLKNQWSKPLLGFFAYRNRKTTLLTQLIPILRNRDSSGMIKHAHHNFEMDREGKDSFRFVRPVRPRSCWPQVNGFYFMKILKKQSSPGELLQRMNLDPLDLVLVEGFKHHMLPEIKFIVLLLEGI